jgi:L-asparagine oxygenase
VLSGDEKNLQICFDEHFLRPLEAGDDEAARALAELRRELDRVAIDVSLRDGDVLAIDNRRTVHARSGFTPDYGDGRRWLIRSMVTGSLRDHREHGSRIYGRSPIASASQEATYG